MDASPRMTRAAAAAATAATPQPMRDGSDADPNCALAGKRCSRLCNMCSATGHGCTPAMGGLRPTMFRIKSSVALTKMQAADGTAMFSADEIASGKVCVHGRKEANDLYEAITDTPAPKKTGLIWCLLVGAMEKVLLHGTDTKSAANIEPADCGIVHRYLAAPSRALDTKLT